jgi:hypothetical protein
VRVPETENHLLMINTSRFLTNQIIIDANPADVHFFVDDQKEVKEWLLRRLQRIATRDFDEYNSRPYQRYSIVAILNMYDFVRCDDQVRTHQPVMKDCDLKRAAQIVLDLATAKFAASSNQGRRVAPFRRLMEVVEDDIGDRHRLTDSSAGSDYMFGFMLAYAGHTHLLPGYRAEFGAAFEMIYPATSRYAPAPAVMSIALGEKRAFEQRIRHAGAEIYSSTPSFLIIAGGVRTPSPTPMTLAGLTIGERCIDRGAALPTVLIPTGGIYDGKMSPPVLRTDFLRIEGFNYFYTREGPLDCLGPNERGLLGPPAIPVKKKDRTYTWSHDDNLCVYKGFACGTNIVVPTALEDCFAPQQGTPWAFLNSATCPAMPNTPPFFVALFRKPCPSEAENCIGNWGFFHAVEAPPAPDPTAANAALVALASFGAFRDRVLDMNHPRWTPDPPGGDDPLLAGSYFTPYVSKSERIDFDAAATMNDENKPGVGAVNGVLQADLDKWPLASGDIIDSKSCPSATFFFSWANGKIEISGKGNGVTIDFCDWSNPTRTIH